MAAATVSAMMRQQPSLARTHLFLPLTSPLRQLTAGWEVGGAWYHGVCVCITGHPSLSLSLSHSDCDFLYQEL